MPRLEEMFGKPDGEYGPGYEDCPAAICSAKDAVDEVVKATSKFPTWPTDPLHALAVLGEEFGELSKEVVQMTYEPHKTSAEAIRTEAIQTAAMAIRFLMSLDSYEYTPREQHSQNAKGHGSLPGAQPRKHSRP